MAFSVSGMTNASAEAARADSYSGVTGVRLFTVGQNRTDIRAPVPLEFFPSVEEGWQAASQASIARGGEFGFFSAVCWEMGRTRRWHSRRFDKLELARYGGARMDSGFFLPHMLLALPLGVHTRYARQFVQRDDSSACGGTDGTRWRRLVSRGIAHRPHQPCTPLQRRVALLRVLFPRDDYSVA